MNTKQISMVAVMAVVLVAAAVSPSLASAQEVAGGKFTLPCTTYWGNAVLPAGNYTYTISRAGGDSAILRVHGEKSLTTMVIADRDRFVKESALEVRRSGGSAVVTNMHVAQGGISMNFRAASAAKELLASASTKPEVEKIILTVD